MSHTPEPWTYGKDDWDYYYLVEAVQKPEGILCEGLDEEDAQRIVQCVNACAGIEDPEAYIVTLQSRLVLAVKALKDAYEIMHHEGITHGVLDCDQNHPYANEWISIKKLLTQIKGGADDNR